MGYKMTKEQLLELRALGLTFAEIGCKFSLTERQVNYRTKKWGLDFSKKKHLNEHFFSQGTKAAYYWAGMLASDGWIEGCRDRVGLALQSGDLAHIEKFKEAVSSDHSICPFMNGAAYRIRFNSSIMCNDLANRFNIVPAKTHIYSLPYFEEDYLMLHFLRGYIDGDGCISTTSSGKAILSIASAVPQVLNEIKEIFEILLNKQITQCPRLNINKKGECYSIAFTVEDSGNLLNLLYKHSTEATRLDRKFKKASLILR